ncbi:hypothetical protein MetMK1DRAFT_00016410 [Metallosphaera yellowstonensis MK1]|uniref:Uncharacterized protein n=1 Tax=Metallosphaera yellowstonensis MK1 TaxID=671065 RepID=H2C141_9CREN|nr:hypothetical protein MetMK1DRAFT_00016410 [Metallosphaera yellowstonensis MK1]
MTDLLPAMKARFPEVSRITPLYGCYSVVVHDEREKSLSCLYE